MGTPPRYIAQDQDETRFTVQHHRDLPGDAERRCRPFLLSFHRASKKIAAATSRFLGPESTLDDLAGGVEAEHAIGRETGERKFLLQCHGVIDPHKRLCVEANVPCKKHIATAYLPGAGSGMAAPLAQSRSSASGS